MCSYFDLLVICQLSQNPALLPTTYIKEVLGQIHRGLGWLRLTPCLPARVCRHWSDVVGLLLLAGGTEQGFAYYKQNRRAILSRRCLWGSARLALIEPIAIKSPVTGAAITRLRYINPQNEECLTNFVRNICTCYGAKIQTLLIISKYKYIQCLYIIIF